MCMLSSESERGKLRFIYLWFLNSWDSKLFIVLHGIFTYSDCCLNTNWTFFGYISYFLMIFILYRPTRRVGYNLSNTLADMSFQMDTVSRHLVNPFLFSLMLSQKQQISIFIVSGFTRPGIKPRVPPGIKPRVRPGIKPRVRELFHHRRFLSVKQTSLTRWYVLF